MKKILFLGCLSLIHISCNAPISELEGAIIRYQSTRNKDSENTEQKSPPPRNIQTPKIDSPNKNQK